MNRLQAVKIVLKHVEKTLKAKGDKRLQQAYDILIQYLKETGNHK